MPRINPSTGAVVMGVSGAVSIDGVVYADRGTNASWLHPSTIIAQCGDDGWRVGICEVGAPKQWAAYDARGCNFLSAGGGLWQAELAGSGSFGEYGDQPNLSLGLLDGDGRGYPGPNGEMNLVPAGGLGIHIHTRGVGVYVIACGPARFVQVLGPQAAVWADDAGMFWAEGVPTPAQAAPGSSPHYCKLPDGSVWNVCFSSAHGLIAHRWEDASEGVVLAGPGVPAWFPDARVVNGKLIAAWASGAGELPHELVVERDVLSRPRVVFDAAPPVTPPVTPPVEPVTPPVEPVTPPAYVGTAPPDNGIDAAGVCVNPEHYFQSLTWNQPPAEFERVFRDIEAQLWMYGFGFQCRSDGTPSSRLYLPTAICPSAGAVTPEDAHLGVKQDPQCWSDEYAWCGADTIENDASGRPIGWTWQWRGAGAGAYQPVPAPGGTTPPEPGPTPPLPYGPGYLRTNWGDCLRAKRKTGEVERGDAQLWTLADEGEGRVSMRVGGSGKYVCCDPNAPDDPLYANRDSVGPWERFHVEPGQGGGCAFRSEANGLYMCADDTGRIVANRPTVGPWETFTFEAD